MMKTETSKRVWNIIVWSLIAVYIAVSFSFVAEKQDALVCNKIEVCIVDSSKNGFVLKENILNLLQRKNIKLIGKNFSEIDLKELEGEINSFPPVANSQIYKTVDGRIIIQIKQRNPILRIIDVNNDSYYIDDKGYVMKLSSNYTSHVLIANGNINTKFTINNKTNVIELENESQGRRVIQADLYKLAKYVNNNKFWNAQIQQIFVNFSGDFELIPRVGSNVIIFGDYSDCENKFSNLMSLYKHGLPAVGWNKYESINLKYKGQVICTKRENL
jgi:cell division protein FtsQ